MSMNIPNLEELAARDAIALFARAASHSSGLFLVSGQAGSGKSTVALGMARALERRGAKIVFMSETGGFPGGWHFFEQPTNWSFPVPGTTSEDWRRALGAIPAGPPHVVLVNDITVENVVPLFESAHDFRIITCIDTPLFGVDVAYSLRGWGVDMAAEIPPLRLLWSQVLLPRLCLACRKPVTLDPLTNAEFNPGGQGTLEAWVEVGCNECKGKGLKGRLPAYEIVVLDDSTREEVQRATRDNDAAVLPPTHHLSLPAVARQLLLAGEIGVETYRQEVARNPLLRAERLLARERDLTRRTRDLFRRFVDEGVIEQFIAAPDLASALEGRRVEATCLFCDIRGFTTFSEKHDPREVFRVLNELIDAIIAVVTRHGGMVDKIIGDSVMAIFGLPIYRPQHAADAVACAGAIQERIAQLGREHPERAALKVGIGINSGELAAGCLGNTQRMDYTVLGDVVNTAARLESLAGPGQILIGPSTRALLGERIRVRDLGDTMLKGKSESVRVFELES